MRNILAALAVLTALTACSSDQKKQEHTEQTQSASIASGTDSLSYTYDSVKVYSKTPVSKDRNVTDTAKAVIVYPVFKDEATNKFIKDRVIGQTGKQDTYHTYKEAAHGFIKEYDAYRSLNQNTAESWFENLNVKVITNYPGYLSLLHTYTEYKGGAHANTLFTYFNYNPASLQTITLDSLITAEGMPKLRSVAEHIFRRNEQLAPNANLSDNYFFPEGIFSLPETFTVTKDGIKFLYNPDEIKPHAAGTTELTVPFSKIKDVMKESSILKNFN